MQAGEKPVQPAYLLIWLAAVIALVLGATIWHNEVALTDLVILVSLVVHECGHALAARFTGFKILFGRLGNGPVLARTHIGTVPLELRLFPLTGAVAAVSSNPKWLRTRVAIYALAGVITTVMLAAIVFSFVGDDLRVALVAASIIQALNLLPIGFMWRGIPRASDGRLIVNALFGARSELEERYVAPVLRQQYLDQIMRDPTAALATAETYATLANVKTEADVMATCARAGRGETVTAEQLTLLWSTTPPSWTDMLLAWCTDKTVRDAVARQTIDEHKVHALQLAIARVPDSPDLHATLARALAANSQG